jgi:hypothetical protein
MKVSEVGKRSRLVAILATVGIVLCIAACGASASSQAPLSHGCESPETKEIILLKTSGLSCANAKAILYLLVAEDSRPQIIRTPAGAWRCGDAEHGGSAKEVSCRHGRKEFVILPES